MKHVIWTRADISGLECLPGVDKLLTEVDPRGVVTREIGLNAAGLVIYKSSDGRGLFDGAKIDLQKLKPEISNALFEELWARKL